MTEQQLREKIVEIVYEPENYEKGLHDDEVIDGEKTADQILHLIDEYVAGVKADGRRIQADATLDKWLKLNSVNATKKELQKFDQFIYGQNSAWQHEAEQRRRAGIGEKR